MFDRVIKPTTGKGVIKEFHLDDGNVATVLVVWQRDDCCGVQVGQCPPAKVSPVPESSPPAPKKTRLTCRYGPSEHML